MPQHRSYGGFQTLYMLTMYLPEREVQQIQSLNLQNEMQSSITPFEGRRDAPQI